MYLGLLYKEFWGGKFRLEFICLIVVSKYVLILLFNVYSICVYNKYIISFCKKFIGVCLRFVSFIFVFMIINFMVLNKKFLLICILVFSYLSVCVYFLILIVWFWLFWFVGGKYWEMFSDSVCI